MDDPRESWEILERLSKAQAKNAALASALSQSYDELLALEAAAAEAEKSSKRSLALLSKVKEQLKITKKRRAHMELQWKEGKSGPSVLYVMMLIAAIRAKEGLETADDTPVSTEASFDGCDY